MSQKFDIHLTPENFPRFNADLVLLLHTMMQETEDYCKARALPPVVAISIFSGLCIQAENQIRECKQIALEEIPTCQTEHRWINEDGTSTPMQPADFSASESPQNLN